MFFKRSQFKIKSSRTTIIFSVILLVCFLFIVKFIIKNRFADEENAVYEGLIEELETQEFCMKKLTCATKIGLYHRSGKRIYFNMYGQKDMVLVASISKFLVKKGIQLTKGVPVTLKVYSTPKVGYLNFDYFFGHEYPLLKLEIEK